MSKSRIERRRWPRLSVQGLVASFGETTALPVLMVNMGGLLLHTARFVSLGEEGIISMNLEGKSFSARAEAVFIGPDNSISEKKVGLAFRQFEGESQNHLTDFVRTLTR